MSEAATASPGSAGPWPVLDVQERRVLGVLVEKAKTTADAYPMSVNALVTGCNQKSNRDPLLNLSDLDVEETLARCLRMGLVQRIQGGRVERWKHLLYEVWQVDKLDLAVLAELLLRGPQTEGELRGRASRMEPLEDLDALRAVLRPLVQRKLVVYLTPEDRRGAVLTHGFHDPRELEGLRAHHASLPAGAAPAGPASAPAVTPAGARGDDRVPGLQAELAGARDEIAELRRLVTDLQGVLAGLQAEVRDLKQALGV